MLYRIRSAGRLTVALCAFLRQVEPVTVRRCLRESGSGYRHHLSDDELLAQLHAVSDLEGQSRADGFRTGQAALMAHAGLRPPRQQVLEVRRAHDPAASEARQERLLGRRPYDVQAPMELWHFDSERSPPKNSSAVCRAPLCFLGASNLDSFSLRSYILQGSTCDSSGGVQKHDA